MARNQAEKQLFDLLVTRNFDPQTLDSQGKPAATPEDAHLFSFDYKGESGKDYGTVVVMLNDDNSMSVFTGDNTGKSMEGDDKKGWFDFQAQLKRFAMQNLMSFNLQNLNKLKYSMQGQAALSEGLFESWQGKKDVSYNADATQARLMIKHKRNIGEGEARFRNIQALFIETADGERFKLPFTKLSGGRAMLEHVRQGGRPYDMRGAHIANIVNEMNLLARFKRANQSRIFEGEVANLVEQANNYYESLQHSLKSLGSKTGYTKYFETWNPADITDEDVIIEDLRHMFVEQNIDARVEQALPLLAKLQQEQAMKEINVFEGWMNLLSEGTWALPDTPEKQQQLVSLLSQELPVGPDATNATEQLYDILGDDELFDKLGALAEQDANADARTVILDRLEEMKSNPAVAQVIGKLKIESTPQAPAEQPAQQEPVQEDESCHVCHKAKPVCECSLEEGQDTVEKDATGKVKSWKHEGDWEKTKKVKGKEVDPRGEVTHMSDKARRETEKLDELSVDKLDAYRKKADKQYRSDPDTAPMKRAVGAETADEKIKQKTGKYNPTFIDKLKSRFSEEQLDELSPSTLGSYIKRASSDRAMRNFDQGVDTGSTFQDREPKFDKHNSRKDDQRRKGIHKAVNRLVKESRIMESGMSEVDILLQDIARGNVDIYNIYAAPKTNVENFVSDQIHDRVEEISRERGIPQDDDIDKILQIIVDDLCDEYGIDEAYDSPLDTPDAVAAREKLRQAMLPVKKQHPNHPALKNFKSDEEMEETVGGGNWLEESLADFESWAQELSESEWISSDKPLTTSPSADSRAQDARSKKQDMLKKFAQLGDIRAEFIWAADHDVFMTKEQILDYLDQTAEDPDLTPLEYMHNNGYSADGLLKGMLKSVASMGLNKADVLGIFKNASRGNHNAAPGTISRAAKGLLRSVMSEDASDSKAWMAQVKSKYPTAQFIQAKMPGAPIRAMVDGKTVAEFKTPPANEARVSSASTRAGLARRAQINAMSPEERKAYDEQQAEKVRKRDNARMEKERAEHARRMAKKDVAEGAMKDIGALYADWMSSEFAPFDSDAGDDREVIRKAESFLRGQVAPEKIEAYAEALADQYHGGTPGTSSNWLEEGRDMFDIDDIRQEMKQVMDLIDIKVKAGARIGLGDPLSKKLQALKNDLAAAKFDANNRANAQVKEETALQGQYGHSGKLQTVAGIDQDMMDRIKFLAGVTK